MHYALQINYVPIIHSHFTFTIQTPLCYFTVVQSTPIYGARAPQESVCPNTLEHTEQTVSLQTQSTSHIYTLSLIYIALPHIALDLICIALAHHDQTFLFPQGLLFKADWPAWR